MEPRQKRPATRSLTRPAVIAGLCVAATAVAAACSSLKVTTSTSGPPAVVVAMQVTDPSASGSVSGGSAGGAQLRPSISSTIGDSSLTISAARVVLREFELRRSSATGPCTQTPSGQSSDSDQCDEITTNPAVFDLPLTQGSTAQRVALGQVEVETYSELWFRIHDLSPDDSADQQLINQNPELDGASVQLTGTWNGTAFNVTLPLGQIETLGLGSPLQLQDGSQVAIGITVDLASWFQDPDTGRLIDPKTAETDQAVRDKILSNIPGSFTLSITQL